MSSNRLLSFAVLLAALLIGVALPCRAQNAASPRAQAAAALDADGTYYLLADQKLVGSQLRFLLECARPEAEEMLKMAPLPISYDDVTAQLADFCVKAGLDRTAAIGKSSKLLKRENGVDLYHNRMILAIEPADELPVFLRMFAGNEIELKSFLGRVPNDALSATTFVCDLGVFWSWLNRSYPVTEAANDLVSGFIGTPAPEFLAGISGRVFLTALPGNDELPVRFFLEMPDRGGKLGQLLAQLSGIGEAEAGQPIALPLGEDAPIKQLFAFLGQDQLQLASDAETLERLRQQLPASSVASEIVTDRIPEKAVSYSVENCLGAGTAGAAPRWSINAITVSADNLSSYGNDYCDWNVMGGKVLIGMLPQLRKLLENYRNADDADDLDIDTALTLTQSALENYRDANGSLPEAGRAGILAALKDHAELADEDKEQLAESLVFFGSMANLSATPDQLPFLFERPDVWVSDKLIVVFADGHREELTPPIELASCLELIDFINAKLHYAPADLKALKSRAQALDEELGLEHEPTQED